MYTWCQESYQLYTGQDDKEYTLDIIPTQSRVLRGGSFYNLASNVRSAFRNLYVPTFRININGFRPSRTLPLGSFTALRLPSPR